MKNIREYGIMKAMGITTKEMSILIVMIIALMNSFVSAIGLLIGSIAVWGISKSGGIDIAVIGKSGPGKSTLLNCMADWNLQTREV